MTRCLISSKGWRRPVRVAVALCIVMVAVLLAIHMIIPSASAEGNSTHSVTPFITIDAIGNHTIGEIYFINGTTNLPVSEKLTMYIESSEWVGRTHMKFTTHPPSGEYVYDIPVSLTTSATPGLNRWSVNLTDLAKTLVIQEYLVDVVSHDTGTNALFTLLPVNLNTTPTVLRTTSQSPSLVQSTTHAVIFSSTTQSTPLPLELPIAVLAVFVFLRHFGQEKRD